MVKTSNNAVIKEWKLNDANMYVKELIYTNNFIIQLDNDSIKIRYDTNFAFEDKFKCDYFSEVYAMTFKNTKVDDKLQFFVIGKSNVDTHLPPDKKDWNPLEIAVYTQTDGITDYLPKKLKTPENYRLYGNCYVLKITPDNKKLVAATYQMIGDEKSISY